MKTNLPVEIIERRIYFIRGQKVMLDRDLAQLYGVETKALKRAVRRNIDRFPDDFMFRLSAPELANLRRQFGTSSWGGQRYRPFAFTEQGVAMLSGVLNSRHAVQVNIAIMRVFVRLRQLLASHRDLADKLERHDRRLDTHDESIRSLFDAIQQLLDPPEKPRRAIGFRLDGA